MKYFPLVWSALRRKPAEAVLTWLAVTAAFTLFGLMAGLRVTYGNLIESSRMDRLDVNARFPSASPTGILLPVALRGQIARIRGVSAVGTYFWLWGHYQQPSKTARVIAVDDHMRAAWSELPLPGGEWPIVGIFTDGGSILQGELVADAPTLLSAAHMSGYGSVLARLARPDAFDAFAHWLETNPTLRVTAERQSHYAVRTTQLYAGFFTEIAYVLGAIMALGALFGTVKLTYSAVSARTHEIGTLRAIGYQPLPVAVAVLLESVLLALGAALAGTATAWILFDGRQVADIHNVFDLSVSPRLFAIGLAWAVGIAVLGGLPPAIRAARLTVTAAHRAP